MSETHSSSPENILFTGKLAVSIDPLHDLSFMHPDDTEAVIEAVLKQKPYLAQETDKSLFIQEVQDFWDSVIWHIAVQTSQYAHRLTHILQEAERRVDVDSRPIHDEMLAILKEATASRLRQTCHDWNQSVTEGTATVTDEFWRMTNVHAHLHQNAGFVRSREDMEDED